MSIRDKIRKPENKKEWFIGCCGGIIVIFIIMGLLSFILIGNNPTDDIYIDTGNITSNNTTSDTVNLDNFEAPNEFSKGALDGSAKTGLWSYQIKDINNEVQSSYSFIVLDYENDKSTCDMYTQDNGSYIVQSTDQSNIYYGLDSSTGEVNYFEVVEKDGHKYCIISTGLGDNQAAALQYLLDFNGLNNLKPINFK